MIFIFSILISIDIAIAGPTENILHTFVCEDKDGCLRKSMASFNERLSNNSFKSRIISHFPKYIQDVEDASSIKLRVVKEDHLINEGSLPDKPDEYEKEDFKEKIHYILIHPGNWSKHDYYLTRYKKTGPLRTFKDVENQRRVSIIFIMIWRTDIR